MIDVIIRAYFICRRATAFPTNITIS